MKPARVIPHGTEPGDGQIRADVVSGDARTRPAGASDSMAARPNPDAQAGKTGPRLSVPRISVPTPESGALLPQGREVAANTATTDKRRAFAAQRQQLYDSSRSLASGELSARLERKLVSPPSELRTDGEPQDNPQHRRACILKCPHHLPMPKMAHAVQRFVEAPDEILWGLDREHWLRSPCLMFISSDWFDMLVGLVILTNAIILCLYNPLQPQDQGVNIVVNRSNYVFSVLFTMEMIIKILAVGVYGRGSYLGDPWNWLDLIVVALSWASLSPTVGNVSSVRLLRLLRSLAFVPGMRVVLNAVLNSLPGLFNVCILAFVAILVFAMVGLTLWSGVLRGQCAYVHPITNEITFVEGPVLCAMRCDAARPGCVDSFGDSCAAAAVAFVDTNGSSFSNMLPAFCTEGQNPDDGQTSFDNFGTAMLTSFVFITTEGWTSTVQLLWHAWGLRALVSALSTVHVIFTAWVILELSLAVVTDRYLDAVESERRRTNNIYRLLLQLNRDTATSIRRISLRPEVQSALRAAARGATVPDVNLALVRPTPIKRTSVQPVHVELASPRVSSGNTTGRRRSSSIIRSPTTARDAAPQSMRSGRRSSAQLQLAPSEQPPASVTPQDVQSAASDAPTTHPTATVAINPVVAAPSQIDGCAVRFDVSSSPDPPAFDPVPTSDDAAGSVLELPPHATASDIVEALVVTEARRAAVMKQSSTQRLRPVESTMELAQPASGARAPSRRALLSQPSATKGRSCVACCRRHSSALRCSSVTRVRARAVCCRCSCSKPRCRNGALWRCCAARFNACVRFDLFSSLSRSAFRVGALLAAIYAWVPPVPAVLAVPARLLVHSWIFYPLMTAAVIANAIVLACEYEGMPHAYEQGLVRANYAFVGIFAVEMLLRGLAEGPRAYLSNAFNAFDALIVIVSIVDAVLDASPAPYTTTGTSAIRVLRVLRVLRVVRSWRGLQNVLENLARAIPNAMNAVIILLVFQLCMAVVGMQLFGGGYAAAVARGAINAQPPLHFNDLWHAFVTIFHVVDNENWNDTLHLHMAAFGPSAALFFLAVVIIGNYLFLNIMVAVLIGNFGESRLSQSIESAPSTAIAAALSPSHVITHVQKLRDVGRRLFDRCAPLCNFCHFSSPAHGSGASHHIGVEDVPANCAPLADKGTEAMATSPPRKAPPPPSPPPRAPPAPSHRPTAPGPLTDATKIMPASDAFVGQADAAVDALFSAPSAPWADGVQEEPVPRESTPILPAPSAVESERTANPRVVVTSPLDVAGPASSIHRNAHASTATVRRSAAPGIMQPEAHQCDAPTVVTEPSLPPGHVSDAAEDRDASSHANYANGYAPSARRSLNQARTPGPARVNATPASTRPIGHPAVGQPPMPSSSSPQRDINAGRRRNDGPSRTDGAVTPELASIAGRAARLTISAPALPETAALAATGEANAVRVEFGVTARVTSMPALASADTRVSRVIHAGPIEHDAQSEAGSSAAPDQGRRARAANRERGAGTARERTGPRQTNQAFDWNAAIAAARRGSTDVTMRVHKTGVVAGVTAVVPGGARTSGSPGGLEGDSVSPAAAAPIKIHINRNGEVRVTVADTREEDALLANRGRNRSQSRPTLGFLAGGGRRGTRVGPAADGPIATAPRAASPVETAHSDHQSTSSRASIFATIFGYGRGKSPHGGPSRASGITPSSISSATAQVPLAARRASLLAEHPAHFQEARGRADERMHAPVPNARELQPAHILSWQGSASASSHARGSTPASNVSAASAVAGLPVRGGSGVKASSQASTASASSPGYQSPHARMAHQTRKPPPLLAVPTEDRDAIVDTVPACSGGCVHCCVTAYDAFRYACARLVTWPWFDRVVMFVILLASINLALDEPWLDACTSASCNALTTYLLYADYAITALFTLEMVIQIAARGLFAGQHAFFRDGWRVLDFFVVAISLASVSTGRSELRSLRALRALRALRPLRVLSRFPSLKLVVNALIASLPRVVDVAVVLLLFMYVFAVIGLQTFRGLLYVCNDPSVTTRSACSGTFILTGDGCALLPTSSLEQACRLSPTGAPFPRIWAARNPNFDNIGNALLTVWELGTGENWPTFMVAAEAGTPSGPVDGAAPASMIYFVLAQMVLNQFLVELFTGIIIDTYKALREETGGSILLSSTQKQWVANMRIIMLAQPPAVMAPIRTGIRCWDAIATPLFSLVTRPAFDTAVTVLVALNAIVIATMHYGQSPSWDTFQDRANAAFTAVFAVEACLKLAGLGPRQYWAGYANRFDIVIVVGSIISAILSAGSIGLLLRLFRIARLFRLLRASAGLQRLTRTLFLSLPIFANIVGLLALDIFVFAVIAMNLFGGIRVGSGSTLDADSQFNDFGTTVFTLIRSATGENFNGLMHDLTVQEPYCSPADNNCGVSLGVSAVYWTAFYSITAWIVVSLLTAAILEAFEKATEDTNTDIGVYRLTHAAAEQYARLWAQLDPDRALALPVDLAAVLIAQLPYPLGTADAQAEPSGAPANGIDVAAETPASPQVLLRTTTGAIEGIRRSIARPALIAAEKLVHQLPIVPDEHGRVAFHGLLHALVDHASTAPPLGERVGRVVFTGALRSSLSGIPLVEIAAAKRLQIAWRAHRRRRGIREGRALSPTSEASSSTPRGGPRRMAGNARIAVSQLRASQSDEVEGGTDQARARSRSGTGAAP